MKTLPLNAKREITSAMYALQLCLEEPQFSPSWIQKAVKHAKEANSWIVARQLRDDLKERNKPIKEGMPF